MIKRSEIMQFTCSTYDLIYPGIAEFNYPAGFNINNMIMLAALICSFKLCNVLTELVLDDKAAVKKQFNCVVKCSPAYPVILILHEDIKGFNVEMT